MIGAVSDGIVGVVKAGHRHKALLSALGLLLALVVGVAYLFLGALQVNPLQSVYRMKVELPASGGLLANQPVTLRGNPIGRVESLSISDSGINANIRLDSSYEISESTAVRVTGLSAAGEQYIDFDGGDGKGPFLREGSVIPMGRTPIPVTMGELLGHADGALKQIDPDKMMVIRKELSLSKEGPQKLTDIVEGGTFLLSALDSVLPETTSLLQTSRISLNLLADKNAGMKVATANLDRTFTGIAKMQNGFRTLTEQTPKTLSATDNLFTDNSDTMVQLLGNLVSVSQLLYVRVPALDALFPDYRGSMLDALGSTFHDQGWWATADIYPRYSCNYGNPRRSPSAADYPEPFMYGYCSDTDPAVLIRGAKNAPRPAGDDTYGPPPGADLGKQTDPTPKGRYSVGTDYGGPVLPIEPPS